MFIDVYKCVAINGQYTCIYIEREGQREREILGNAIGCM